MTPASSTPKKPRAFLYSRVSTLDQAKEGRHGLIRQQEEAETWALRNGYVIDTALTFRDEGVSGFRGKNVTEGAMKRFLQAVADGLVPKGSVLVVDSLDRIGRRAPRRTFRVLEDIVDAGVDVATTLDGKLYTASGLDEDIPSLLVAILVLARGYEESSRKSDRVKLALANRREKARRGELIFTKKLPGWIQLEEGKKTLSLRPDRVKYLRLMVKLRKEGWGYEGIAKQLNTRGIPPFKAGRWWQRSGVQRILESPALHGVFVPHESTYDEKGRLKRVPLPAIPNYFPPVLTKAEFLSLHKAKGRKGARPITSPGTLRNPFSGVLTCALCGSALMYVLKERGKPGLVCSRAKGRAGCVYRGTPLSTFTDAFLLNLSHALSEVPIYSEELEAKLTTIASEIEGLDAAIDTVTDNLQRARSASLSGRLRELEASREQVRQRERKLLDHAAMADRRVADRPIETLEAAAKAGTIADPRGFNEALRELAEEIAYDPVKGWATILWKGERSVDFVVRMPPDKEPPRKEPKRGK